MDVVMLVVGILCSVGLLMFVMVLWFRRLADRAERALRESIGDDRVVMLDRSANFVGATSGGLAQVRGNGVLMLTERELRFRMWVPQRQVVIRRDRITGVDSGWAHTGKTKGVPLLKVSFVDKRGGDDVAAWAVKDGPKAWMDELRPAEGSG